MTREEAIMELNQFSGTTQLKLSANFWTALNKAIKALEQEPRWIPVVRREPTDEEKAEYLAQNGEELCYVLENEMPLHGQEVLVSIGKYVSEDVFDEDFYNFENAELSDVDAWMPSPEPYKADNKTEQGLAYADQDTMMPAT